MKKFKNFKRVFSILLVLSLLAGNLLVHLPNKVAADTATSTVGIAADEGTAHTWENMMGTSQDGNRYAGRVWVDKSVYTDGQTAKLNSSKDAGSTFKVSLNDDEAFQVIFSALGSSMTTTTTTSTIGPMDVVLILDTSTSMDDREDGQTRLRRVVNAANKLLADLLKINDVRVAIVTYNYDSETVLLLDSYNNGVTLYTDPNKEIYTSAGKGGIIIAQDKDGKELGKDNGYKQGTNLQSGIDRGFKILANASNAADRNPVAIVLTDGEANHAVRNNWYNIANGNVATNYNFSQGLILSTLLNAAYNRAVVEKHYGTAPVVYGVSVDLDQGSGAHTLMNPGDSTYGFNSNNRNTNVSGAYAKFLNWKNGETVYTDNLTWVFNHNLPSSPAITSAEVAANINYVDHYYDVSGANLEAAFKEIYEELSSAAFNPISSTTTNVGGTGEKNTPLIYVDNIGQYMEVKDIQAITLFGASYNVVKGNDGTYTVEKATGTNPTTNEAYDTSKDIKITVTTNADGTQKLEIRINQAILPIILDKVVDKTVSGTNTVTLNELLYHPLRVYYTVGLDSDILLPNGNVDIAKIDGYKYLDTNKNEITFYSNAFGVSNTADADADGLVELGDAHVGFKPSVANRYYYHQTNQGIFTKITSKANGSTVTIPENDQYGIVWDESKYNLNWMTYDEYKAAKDSDKVYTYVSYYRPTGSGADAEKVTYLVYTNWEYLKESIAFYNDTTGEYLNEGRVMSASQIAAYVSANPNAEIYAVLGVGSHRTSRFHNMTVAKVENTTGTAELRYVPEYTYDTANLHNGNDVVVWLGNNGKLTVKPDTGIALTKQVTEAIGNANDTYALTVTVPAGVTATPAVYDVNGKAVTSTYSGNVLTVNVKAGETVYVSGIPVGIECTIGEVINGDYTASFNPRIVTIPTMAQVLAGTSAQFVAATVTNTPNKYGNLFITKEIASDHSIPDSILNEEFEITVNVGTTLAGKTFAVSDSENVITSATVAADGTMTFEIKARQTIEILGLPAGTVATVTEKNVDSHFKVTYRTRDYAGATADTDGTVTIPANANATAVITNKYTPTSVSVNLDIEGTKNFVMESSAASTYTFDFKVQEWRVSESKSEWVDISEKTAHVTFDSNSASIETSKGFTIKNVLEGKTYTETGSWAYQVVEVIPNDRIPNLTYDRTLYTFTVTVTDNGGQLVATVTDLNNVPITDGSYEVTFNNTYHTAPVSIDIVKDVVNKSGDVEISKAGFGFTAIQTNEQWIPLIGNDAKTLHVSSDAAGEARLTATYTETGTYYYVVKETNTGKPGWSYSNTEYHVTVNVIDDGTGNLTSEMTIVAAGGSVAEGEKVIVNADKNSGTISFVNTYDPTDASLNLNTAVKKALTGKILEAGVFEFKVYKDGDRTTALLSGTNDAEGNVTFNDALYFSKVGKYEYDIVEVIPEGAVKDEATGKYVFHGMSYDPTIYDMVVEVNDNQAEGKLVAVWYFEDSTTKTVTFTNEYTVKPTEYTLSGLKTLNGRAISVGEFKFELYEGDNLLETVTNDAHGAFNFTTIPYDKAGTYTYTIKEVKGNTPGVTYTGADKPITVTVTVTDTNGVLSASANDAIKFTNEYHAKPANVTFGGNKNLIGKELTSGMFTFELYETDSTFDITGKTPIATAKNSGKTFAFNAIKYDTAGNHFYVIVEKADPANTDIIYDITQYQFHVQVRDDGVGQLKATVLNLNTGKTTDAAASVTENNVTFENITLDQVTEKTVYKAGDTTTQIDGQKVNAGDILTYYITYKNYTGYDVEVNIHDKIPAHTSYVEGSVSNGGTYLSSHVTWNLKVKKGEKVTVSFQVKVDETNVIVANQAEIRDGINEYKTNEVHNYVPGDEKDVFSSENPGVSIDGQYVKVGDVLTYVVEYINTSAKAVEVTITDIIPEFTTYVEDSASHDAKFDGEKLTWKLDVPAWGTVVVSFNVTVEAPYEIVKNTAEILEGNNAHLTNEVKNPTIEDIVVKDVVTTEEPTVSVDGKVVKVGEILNYTITYTNITGAVANVKITDTIPQYTEYVAGSADNNGVFADGTITWNLANVEAGKTITVSFAVKVTAAENVTVENTAVAYENNNEIGIESNSVTTDVRTPNLTIEKVQSINGGETTKDLRYVKVGDTVKYIITVKNLGEGIADNVVVTDIVPAGLILKEDSVKVESGADAAAIGVGHGDRTSVRWRLGDLTGGAEVVLSFEVEVPYVIENKVWSNVATVIADNNKDSDTDDNDEIESNPVDVVTVVSEKDVFTTNGQKKVRVDGKNVYAGEILEYVITYKNPLDEGVDFVTIKDTIPANTVYVEGSAFVANSDMVGVYKDGTITWKDIVVPGNNGSVTVKFQVQTMEPTTGVYVVDNQAEVIVSDGANEYTYETNKVTTTVEKVPEVKVPELTIEKTQSVNDGTATKDKLSVKEDDKVTYTVAITNKGNGEAFDVVISDKVPAGLTLVKDSVKVPNGVTFTVSEGNVIKWNVGTLPVDETVKVSFQVEVPAVEKDTEWKNIAEVTYSDSEENKPDDDSTEEKTQKSNEVTVEEEYVEKSPVVETGDNTPVLLWITVMLAAMAATMVLVIKKKKYNR